MLYASEVFKIFYKCCISLQSIDSRIKSSNSQIYLYSPQSVIPTNHAHTPHQQQPTPLNKSTPQLPVLDTYSINLQSAPCTQKTHPTHARNCMCMIRVFHARINNINSKTQPWWKSVGCWPQFYWLVCSDVLFYAVDLMYLTFLSWKRPFSFEHARVYRLISPIIMDRKNMKTNSDKTVQSESFSNVIKGVF